MPRKAALIAEDAPDSVPDSPLRRSTRTRRGSISSLQDEATATVRADSPTAATISNRRRSLRSASHSPTFDSKPNESQATVIDGTPSKIRGRRASAERAAPKRRGSIALDVLDEVNEPAESPMRKMEPKGKKMIIICEENGAEVAEQEPMKHRLSVDRAEESSEASTTKSDEGIRSESSSKTTSLDKGRPVTKDVLNAALHQTMREQILTHPTVVLSPLKPKMPREKAIEIEDFIMEDVQMNKNSVDKIETPTLGIESADYTITSPSIEPTKSDTQEDLDKNVLTDIYEAPSVFPILEEVKISPKSSPKPLRLVSQSPIRRSPRLNSATDSDNSESPARKLENYLCSSKSSSPIIGKTSNIDSSKIITPTQENKLVENISAKKSSSKEIVNGSDDSFHLSLNSSIIPTQEKSLNKSAVDDVHTENKEDTLNVSDESNKENISHVKTSPVNRISNVFSSKNIEESFLESMEVEYPSDNDNSLTAKRVSINETVARAVHTGSEESSSGSYHLICNDDTNEKKTQVNILPDSRQSITLIQLDESVATLNDTKVDVLEIPKTASLLDSRISILTCKVLTPWPGHTKENKKNSSFTKPTQPVHNTASKSKESNKNGDVERDLVAIDYKGFDDEESTEKESGVKFGDLVLTDNENVSDPEYCLDSEDGKITEEYDSIPDVATDEMSDGDRGSDAILTDEGVGEGLRNKSTIGVISGVNEDYLPTKRIVELQSIAIMSSSSSARQSSDSEDEKQPLSNKMKELQSITIKSSSSSESESESKLRQLILNKTAEYNADTDSSDTDSSDTDSSDTDFKSDQLVDDEAMEGSDEDTLSEDSNEIIDVGDNIEDTDDEWEDEGRIWSSDEDFIDDDNVVELLSGNENEDDLDYDNKETVIKKKKRRILIRPVDELEVEENNVEENNVEENNVDVNLPTSVSKSKNKRNSSISVSESIKKEHVVTSEISEKMSDIVNLFCAGLSDKKGGSVNLNMSLDYDESSSNEESIRKPNVSLNTHSANKSLKRKSIEPLAGECDSSTLTSATPSKIKVLQEVRIIGDVEPRQKPQAPSPSKKSMKMKKHHRTAITSIDDDVFLPDSSIHNNSTGLQTTPQPSTVCHLPDNIISHLVERQAVASKTNAKYNKKASMPIPRKLKAEDFSQYCKASTSHGGTSPWTVSILKGQVKPSKHNLRKPENPLKEEIDPKDFKNYMIAKNKPKVFKKSFKDSLKSRKKF